MDIISAYREVGTFRGAAAVSGTTDKTVRRVIARHEAGGGALEHGFIKYRIVGACSDDNWHRHRMA